MRAAALSEAVVAEERRGRRRRKKDSVVILLQVARSGTRLHVRIPTASYTVFYAISCSIEGQRCCSNETLRLIYIEDKVYDEIPDRTR